MTLTDFNELLLAIGRTLAEVPRGWLVAGGIAVVVLLVAVRRLRRMTSEQLSDVSVIVVGAAGMGVAAYGTVRALIGMHQPWPMALLSSLAVEGGALALVFDLYKKSHAGEDARRPRIASWTFAGASAIANISHPPDPKTSLTGLVIFGAIPLLSLYLIEYRAAAKRRARAEEPAEERSWPARVIGAAWRRVWTGAATGLGLDVQASTSETELELRVRRAADQTYALRLTVAAADAAEKQGGKAWRVARRRARWAKRVRSATSRMQAARLHAGVATDPQAALLHAVLVRELVHGPDDAAADWRDVAAAAARTLGRPVRPARTELAEGEPMRVPSARTDSAVVRRLSGARTGQISARLSGPDKPNRSGRSAPDVSELVEDAERILSEIAERGEKPNRPRMVEAFRASGTTLSSDRANALWQLVKDRAPAAS